MPTRRHLQETPERPSHRRWWWSVPTFLKRRKYYNGRYILLPCPLEVLGAGEEKETERVDCSWDEYITNKSSALFTSHTHTGLKTKFHTKMVTIWFFLEKKERGDGCADWVSVEEAQGDAIRWPPYTIQNYPVKFSLLLFHRTNSGAIWHNFGTIGFYSSQGQL